MGIYDRDYGREEPTPWSRVQSPRSITVTLIIINVVVFVAEQIFKTKEYTAVTGELVGYSCPVVSWLGVYGETILQPWTWWRFLTYGFVHDYNGIYHLLFNMIGLYVFGRDVEHRLGRMEFLRFYLVAVIAGGVVGSTTMMLAGGDASTIGASGAVIATAILFACYFPNRELLLMMVLPVKAWVLAVIYVLFDLAGALSQLGGVEGTPNTAFTVHLAGAAFALAYYFRGWNLHRLSWLTDGQLTQRMRQRSRRMRLKLHDPDRRERDEVAEADRILGKIHEQGESSLTDAERKTLERYSRREREKRNL